MKYAKKIIALTMLVIPVLVAAQLPTSQRIVAQVPFEFMVNDKFVPAGECTVQRAGATNNLLIIRNLAAKVGVITASLPGSNKKAATSYALVFNKYGNQYFLAGVKVAGSTEIYRLPRSKAEAELLAQNTTPTDEVLLASLR
jgi:hypothetical protein